jgi:broad specificity phosphatase PhoE
MKTTLYLIRHGATEANLARPPILQGRRQNLPLAPLGIRQAKATRDLLAIRPIEHCYSSPLQRALQTAAIVAAPHGITPRSLEALSECEVGRWEGLDWQTIRQRDGEAYQRFLENPAVHGYPGGESFVDVYQRVQPALEEIWTRHAGEAILVVGHDVVNRTYLAGLLALRPEQARQVTLDNCGISVIVREGRTTAVSTLNAAFHLQGVAA